MFSDNTSDINTKILSIQNTKEISKNYDIEKNLTAR